MTTFAGRRLGPYELLGAIGAGGMGEVHKARDSRLDRTVAVKLLPERFSSDPELVERFTREARAISALSHPHVCALYDVGRENGTDFLVMEYLEGETLSERIAKGPLPLDQVLRFGIQIAGALDAAHRRGIVHRDLKPGNVMLTRSGVKLLDFGLAKLGARREDSSVSRLATAAISVPLTEKGAVLGTFQYMAPEQLEGKDADARTDIFALGAVLYEMAAGKKAFEGKSQASLIASILSSEPPPLSSIQRLAPAALERLVKTCLAKDPDERWQSAHDVKLELEGIAAAVDTSGVSGARRASRAPWIAAAAALLLAAIAGALAVRHARDASAARRPLRLAVLPPEDGSIARVRGFAMSPDGTRLAIVSSTPWHAGALWVRSLDGEPQALAGTERAAFPFWSPDGKWLAFFADGKLKKVEARGGPVQALCDAPSGRGGAWSSDGTIVFTPHMVEALYRVPAGGGAPRPLTRLDASRHDVSHRWPCFLPGGKRFLFFVHADRERTGVYVGALDGTAPRLLMQGISNALWAPPGWLLFVRDGNLMAQRFDADAVALRGDPTPVVESVAFFRPFDSGEFDVAGGVLAWRPSSETPSRLLWFDRSGRQLGALGEADYWEYPRISPDGHRVAVCRVVPRTADGDIWIFDADRNNATRFTADAGLVWRPIWSPDGKRIAYGSNRTGYLDLYEKATDGSAAKPLLMSNEYMIPNDWSADGRRLVFMKSMPVTGWDLAVLDLESGKARPLIATPFTESAASFSPDGRFLAYVSNASGRHELYVRPAEGAGGDRLVSTAGGAAPRWRADGRELFYIASSGKVMSVPIRPGAEFDFAEPVPLFDTHGLNLDLALASYDVSADGQRFLLTVPTRDPPRPALGVLTNWTAALER